MTIVIQLTNFHRKIKVNNPVLTGLHVPSKKDASLTEASLRFTIEGIQPALAISLIEK